MQEQDYSLEDIKVVEIESIIVDPDANPRGILKDDESLQSLVASIQRDGILQPVVATHDEGKIRLVAGYRRVRAASLARLSKIPVYLREVTDPEGAAYDENAFRLAPTPMANARSLDRQKRQLGSVKKVAAARGLSAKTVSDHLKMCELPPAVQDLAMDAREISPEVARAIVRIAKVSGGEDMAAAMAKTIIDDDEFKKTLRRDPLQAIDFCAWKTETFAVKIPRFRLPDVLEGDQLEAITNRCGQIQDALEIRNFWNVHTQILVLDEIASDALNAAGVLYSQTTIGGFEDRRIFDRTLLVDQISLYLDRLEREADEAKKKKPEVDSSAEDPAKPSAHELRKKEQSAARAHNERLGEKLLRRSTRPLGKKQQLHAIKMMALLTIQEDPKLASRGNRLVNNAWKEYDVLEFKNGTKREKVTHLDRKTAEQRLIDNIVDAKSTDEVLRLITDAIVASRHADQAEVAQSKREYPVVYPANVEMLIGTFEAKLV